LIDIEVVCYKLESNYDPVVIRTALSDEAAVLDYLRQRGNHGDHGWTRVEVTRRGQCTRTFEVASNGEGQPNFWRETAWNQSNEKMVVLRAWAS
jgi:hypothetical protein